MCKERTEEGAKEWIQLIKRPLEAAFESDVFTTIEGRVLSDVKDSLV